jgi:hypothetical protein
VLGAEGYRVKIYLCGRYGRKAELAFYAALMAADGHEITASWLSEMTLDDDALTDFGRALAADTDAHDIDCSELVMVFSEAPDSPYGRGGRHFEHGYAAAKGKEIMLVGPFENVFSHRFWTYKAESFEQARELLCGISAQK